MRPESGAPEAARGDSAGGYLADKIVIWCGFLEAWRPAEAGFPGSFVNAWRYFEP
jgi:hypothetical protein